MRSSTQSEIAALAHQASLKGSEGPALVVFSGGTAFNSVAGEAQMSSKAQNPSDRRLYDHNVCRTWPCPCLMVINTSQYVCMTLLQHRTTNACSTC